MAGKLWAAVSEGSYTIIFPYHYHLLICLLEKNGGIPQDNTVFVSSYGDILFQ